MSEQNHLPDPFGRGRGPDADERGQRGRGRGWKLNPVYELLVLGELMVQPMYGYQLHEVANKLLGPYHPLSWGTLYPLIWQLERQGCATSQSERGHGGPFFHGQRGQSRRMYQITEAGRVRFFALMLDPGEYNRDYPDLFTVKLPKFGFLTPEQQRTILEQYQSYLLSLRDYYQGGCSEVAALPGIFESERPHILQLFDYKICSLDAELAWLASQIAGLGRGEQQFHSGSAEKEDLNR